ncbi:hypothetical protein COCNU_03G010300 [Cocos nucifera]|uniref:Uncharacterized protein n=1 Tax=Cocos nucifera TaxID=13894 RepID=A0A8K0I3Y1_COCNU|nr:hypothetical protein COCNU_03G010300 [Cocos nucifera]
MQPFSPHARFFSSLKQAEDRLASERKRTKRAPETCPSSDPLSSPIFLDSPAGPSTRPPGLQENSSGPPLDFLSSSPSPLDDDDDDGRGGGDEDGEAADDIERLMALLGLSAGECAGEGDGVVGHCCDCSGGGGFYSKVAGVKGPKCDKERRRLDGWIDYYYRGDDGGERREPARLAHLLLAKAVYLDWGREDGEDGLGAIGFPDTVKEFLEHDPPDGGQSTEH